MVARPSGVTVPEPIGGRACHRAADLRCRGRLPWFEWGGCTRWRMVIPGDHGGAIGSHWLPRGSAAPTTYQPGVDRQYGGRDWVAIRSGGLTRYRGATGGFSGVGLTAGPLTTFQGAGPSGPYYGRAITSGPLTTFQATGAPNSGTVVSSGPLIHLPGSVRRDDLLVSRSAVGTTDHLTAGRAEIRSSSTPCLGVARGEGWLSIKPRIKIRNLGDFQFTCRAENGSSVASRDTRPSYQAYQAPIVRSVSGRCGVDVDCRQHWLTVCRHTDGVDLETRPGSDTTSLPMACGGL